MAEKDKANPEQRVTMEERWRRAREACAAGTCDPTEKTFHRSGCERRAGGDTIIVQHFDKDGQPVGEPMVLHGKVTVDAFDYNPHGLPDMTAHGEAASVPKHLADKAAAEYWDDTPVVDTTAKLRGDSKLFGPPNTEPSGIKYGGWLSPSACLMGVCEPEGEHDEVCPGPGSAYHKRIDTTGPLLRLPEVKVRRGGLRWPLVTLEWLYRGRREHWWSRRVWTLYVRPRGSAIKPIKYGPLRSEEEARNLGAFLDKLNLEINRRRDQIDDAAR